MQAHKRLIARILSLVLTSSMVITTLPLTILANEEGIKSNETIQEEGSNGSGEVNETTDGSEENNEGTEIFEIEKADTRTNKEDNDHDISGGDFKDFEQADCCSEDDPHVITGKTEEYYIYVKEGTHFIELNGVDIYPNDSPAVAIAKDATVNLILAYDSVNILKTKFSAGISVPTGANLNISGDGELTSTGILNGAGIGASGSPQNQEAGTITIDGGTIIATGGSNGGAGIGGGKNGAGGTITINGGKVTATGGRNGAGIGGGYNGDGGTIAINGGTVTANGGYEAAGIGGGNYGEGGTITISNSDNVTATGGKYAAGIGGGNEGAGGTIIIKDGTVTANGGENAAGIGGGQNGESGTITINGGTVTATAGGYYVAGIGGYSDSDNQTINISGGTIIATGGSSAPGIGCEYGIELERKGTINISNYPNVTAVSSVTEKAISAEKINITSGSIMQFNFDDAVDSGTEIEVKDTSGTSLEPNVSYSPTKKFKSIALTVPNTGEYTAYAGTNNLKHTDNGTMSDAFKVVAGLNNYTIVEEVAKQLVSIEVTTQPTKTTYTVGESFDKTGLVVKANYGDNSTSIITNYTVDPSGALAASDTKVTISYTEGAITKTVDVSITVNEGQTETPSTDGSTSDSSNNIEVEGVDTGKNVQVTTSKTPDIVKDVIEDKFIVGTYEIKKATEPVIITVKVDKKKTKDIFVLQSNPETGILELLTKAVVNKNGKAEFMTDSKEKLTIVTQLYVGFIDTVATIEKPSVTYYVDEDQSFKKGWFLVDNKDWYFADYKSDIVQKGRWVADGQDKYKLAKWYYLGEDGVMFKNKWIANNENGTKWYYVDKNGLFLRDTVIDGYVINAEGYWSK